MRVNHPRESPAPASGPGVPQRAFLPGTRSAGLSFDPAHVLGCSRERALQLFHSRPVTPGEAEAIAAGCYPWRRHLDDPDSYWVTSGGAARILGLSVSQVRRLLDHHRLPVVHHASGVRLMRRTQIETLAEKRPERSATRA